MLKRLLLILCVGIPSWYFSDMDSQSRFYAYVLPIATFLSVLAFCLWLIELFEHLGSEENPDRQDQGKE